MKIETWNGVDSDLKRKFRPTQRFRSLPHNFKSWFLFNILKDFYSNDNFETFMKVTRVTFVTFESMGVFFKQSTKFGGIFNN